MTLQQTLAFAVLGGAMLLFIWGRLRYDLVAVLALLAAVGVLSLLVRVLLAVAPPQTAGAVRADDADAPAQGAAENGPEVGGVPRSRPSGAGVARPAPVAGLHRTGQRGSPPAGPGHQAP